MPHPLAGNQHTATLTFLSGAMTVVCFKSGLQLAGRTRYESTLLPPGIHSSATSSTQLEVSLREDSRALPSDLGYHLHSALLGFAHPATNKWVEIVCAPPPVLRRSNEFLK